MKPYAYKAIISDIRNDVPFLDVKEDGVSELSVEQCWDNSLTYR
jgi:hypothetical protein